MGDKKNTQISFKLGTFYEFLYFHEQFRKYISNHAPHKCKRRIVDLAYLVRYRQHTIKDSDEPWKIYFKGWNNHVLDKKTARNFDKTEKLLGKRVADYCREHNISSMWSDKTSEKKKVTYPWQNK